MATKKETTDKSPKVRKPRTPKYNPEFPTHQYAQQLVNGEIVCCESERNLAKKHLKDLKRQGTKDFPYVFDESRARGFFNFFENCRSMGSDEYYPILPHQMFDNGMLYGWVRKDDGRRKYIKVYKQEAKAQAKTTTCAIKAMFALIADYHYPPNRKDLGYPIKNPIVQLMAVDKIQVNELRDPIIQISRNSPRIKKYINAKKTYIDGTKNGGRIEILSKDFKNKQGSKPHMVIIDELSSHPDNKRATVAEGNLGKQPVSLLEIITTAGDNELSNPAKQEYDYAKQVLKGDIIDESYLPIIREQEKESEIHKPELWQKSNPMFRYQDYEYSKTLIETVERLYNKAFKSGDLELQRQFKIFRMNMWQERAVNSFLKAGELKQLEKLAVSKEEYERLTYGRPKIVGVDLSMNRDLTADAEVFLLDDGRIAIDAHGYLLENKLDEKKHADKQPYDAYEKLGHCTIIPYYPEIHYKTVANSFIKRAEDREQLIMGICYDVAMAKQFAIGLIDGEYDEQFSEERVLEIPQTGKNMHIATTLLKELIVTKRLVWNGNPLLKWCLMNSFEYWTKHGELVKLIKENKDSHRRIDLAAAVVNALHKVEILKQSFGSVAEYIFSDEFGY